MIKKSELECELETPIFAEYYERLDDMKAEVDFVVIRDNQLSIVQDTNMCTYCTARYKTSVSYEK